MPVTERVEARPDQLGAHLYLLHAQTLNLQDEQGTPPDLGGGNQTGHLTEHRTMRHQCMVRALLRMGLLPYMAEHLTGLK